VSWFKVGFLDELADACPEFTGYMAGQQTKTISDRLCAKAATDDRHQKILTAVWGSARVPLRGDSEARRARILEMMSSLHSSSPAPPVSHAESPATVVPSSEVASRPKRGRDEALLLDRRSSSSRPFKFAVGASVRAKYAAHKGGSTWYDGTVSAHNEDGTYQIAYADGDSERRVCVRHVGHPPVASDRDDSLVEPKVEVCAERIDLTGDSPEKRHVTTAARVQANTEHYKRELGSDNEDLHLTQGYLIADAGRAKDRLDLIEAWAKRAHQAGGLLDEFYSEFREILRQRR